MAGGIGAEKKFRRALVAGLLALQAGLLAWMAYRHSPVVDEVAHLPAGLLVWEYGSFDLYRVNPPLVKTIAALPVFLSEAKNNWRRFNPHPAERSQWSVGRDWIQTNGQRSFWLFTLARWAVIPLVLLGGWACFRWAADLYGENAGLLALLLWCFSPSILGNGMLITADAAAAAMGITAGYAFWNWLKNPTWSAAWLAGVTLGLAELTKMTWVVLFGLWPLLWVVWIVSASGGRQPPDARQKPTTPRKHPQAHASGSPQRPPLGQLAGILLLGLYLLNLGYGFNGSLKPLKEYRFLSELLAGDDSRGPLGEWGGNRFATSWLGSVPVPFPEDYMLGVDIQRRDFEQKQPCYLRGQWKEGGWWYWYLYAIGVKVPLGIWLLLGIAIIPAVFCRRQPGPKLVDELVLLAPAIAVLNMVSSQTGFTKYFRYILPALPFLFVFAARTGIAWDRKWKVSGTLTALAASWFVVSSLVVYPHSLSYFNEAAGGSMNGHKHLIDSNIDWGQDYIYLKEWVDEHPEVRPFHLTGYAAFDPRVLGVEHKAVPRDARHYAGHVPPSRLTKFGPRPGWYGVSVHRLHHRQGIYDYFRYFQPVATAGYSISIYHITLDEANRVRREMGLPEVEE